MKILKSIVLITVVAMFAAGCAADGGFSFDPGQGIDPPTWDPTPWDPPVDPPTDEDPPADDPNGPVVYKPLEPPTYSANIEVPTYEAPGVKLGGTATVEPYNSGVMEREVDCDDFTEDAAKDVCVHISCEGSETPGACYQGAAHSVTCDDIYDWASDVPGSCEIFYLKEDLCLTDRCSEQAQAEQRECEKERAAIGDIMMNSGCYADLGAVKEVMDRTAQMAADMRDSIPRL